MTTLEIIKANQTSFKKFETTIDTIYIKISLIHSKKNKKTLTAKKLKTNKNKKLL